MAKKKTTKKSTKKTTKKTTRSVKVPKNPKGFIMELNLSLMKSFFTTFINAEVERVFTLCNKGDLWFIGFNTGNVSMVSFKLSGLETKVKFQGILNTKRFTAYLSTFRGKTFEMLLIKSEKSNKLKIASGRVHHNVAFELPSPDDLNIFESIDEIGLKEYENSNIYNITSENFKDVTFVGSKLSFASEIRFTVQEGILEVSYVPDNKVDESYIDLPADLIEEGDASFCLLAPKFVKTFEIFRGTFELHVDDVEALRGVQNLVIGDDELDLRIIVMVASQAESGEEATTAGEDDTLVDGMDVEGEPEEVDADDEEGDEEFEENDEEDEEEEDDDEIDLLEDNNK